MASDSICFERFELDRTNRQLRLDGVPVELNGRYLDALALLASESGNLVSKDRFLDEVWRGIPVTDEALTQCIKTLRKQLGDDAARPRFIETVPKYGYRFIAAVEGAPVQVRAPAPTTSHFGWASFFLLAGAGTIGGGMAGLIGGLIYGLVGASQPLQPAMGSASILLVLVCIAILLGLAGGAGVSFGISASNFARSNRGAWSVAGGAFGGLFIGAGAKLIGLDAFTLLLGQSPGNITGPLEGMLLGGATGLAVWLTCRGPSIALSARNIGIGAGAGAVAGIAIALLGGRLMAGSLDLLARKFPDSRLSLDQISGLFGENDFGLVSRIVTSGFEGMLFGGCIVIAMVIARRDLSRA